MKLANIFHEGKEMAAVLDNELCLPLSCINRFTKSAFPEDLSVLIREGIIDQLSFLIKPGTKSGTLLNQCALATKDVSFLPPYRDPEKIWGIGLNYAGHARDMQADQPEQYPAGFNKPPTTIVGHGDAIVIPGISGSITCEAELGIIIGREARNIDQTEWLQYVAGFVPVIDVTSLEILKLNPRYLSLSKSFDTFFSFGPVILTPDEIEDPEKLKVSTWHNGSEVASNTVDHMRFSPAYLVGFLSKVFTLKPGDIISTGTPGATEVEDGDLVEARISGFPVLKNYIKKSSHGSAT